MTTALRERAGLIAPNGPEPEWNVALLFPRRGEWTEHDYFRLPDRRGVELANGCLEFLPVPTEEHQILLLYLLDALNGFVKQRALGIVLPAGLRVRVREDQIREPDLVFMRKEHYSRRHSKAWDGADLAMEIVSPDEPSRDYETKRQEYAEAGVAEYWIVDPREERVLVLALGEGAYRPHGDIRRGDSATSTTLPGFSIDVAALFDSVRAE